MEKEELKALIRTCVGNNRRHGISGLLLYDGGNFIQALEGRKEDVVDTFERIRTDSRHTGIIVLIEGEVSSRCFEGWSMGFHHSEKGADPDCDAVFTISEEAIRQRMAPTATDDVLIFMKGFYRQNKRAAAL